MGIRLLAKDITAAAQSQQIPPMPLSMQLHRIRLSSAALQSLNPGERAFLLLAGHIQNELNVLNKAFMACLSRKPQELPIEGQADGLQAQVHARLLAGKLLEAWNVLPKAYFGARVSLGIEADMHPAAKQALARLKGYFRKSPNVIFSVRNAFAHHYQIEHFEEHWQEIAANDGLEVVLGGSIGNNLNLGAELVANRAVLAAVGGPDLETSMARFLDEVLAVAEWFTTFLEGASLVILERALGSPLVNHAVVENFQPSYHVDDVALPYFYENSPRHPP